MQAGAASAFWLSHLKSVSAVTRLPRLWNSEANFFRRSGFRAHSDNRLTLGARQRAQPEPTSPLAPMIRMFDSEGSRPAKARARSMPLTINATVSVLPVVKAVPGWNGRRSVFPSRRMELNPPSVTIPAPSRMAYKARSHGLVLNAAALKPLLGERP